MCVISCYKQAYKYFKIPNLNNIHAKSHTDAKHEGKGKGHSVTFHGGTEGAIDWGG
jgi:hypothetical protein